MDPDPGRAHNKKKKKSCGFPEGYHPENLSIEVFLRGKTSLLNPI
jgi:hypothetical protein